MRDSFFRGSSGRLTPATAIRTTQHRDQASPFDPKNYLKQASIKTTPEMKSYTASINRPLINLKDSDAKTEPGHSPLFHKMVSSQSHSEYFGGHGSSGVSRQRGIYQLSQQGSSNLASPVKVQTPSRQSAQRYFQGFDQQVSSNLGLVSPRSPLISGINGSPVGHRTGAGIGGEQRRITPFANPLATKLGVTSPTSVISYPELCKCRRSPTGTCELAESWKEYIIKKPQDEAILKSSFHSYLRQPKKEEDVQQIEKDVMRTYPELGVYFPESPASRRLINVLAALAVRFPEMGYVQGMNFICASLIYHLKDDHLTYGVFCYFIEFLNLQEVYKEGLPGLKHHSGEFTKKLEKKLPDVHILFEKFCIIPEMYLTEWLIPLGCYHLPLKDTGHLFRLMLKQGWEFFYNLILQYLRILKPHITGLDEMGVLETLKHYTQHGSKCEDGKLSRIKIDWVQAMLDSAEAAKLSG
jgi:hypothetical protein